jgi:Rps23 Pro-64 3,4-dihydroxylase Tpa1-like proline 4-hydroxylase
MRKVELVKAPFPHIIGTDFFADQQLIGIWQELKFLTTESKLFPPGVHHSNGTTESRALCLEEAYRIPEISNILQIHKTILGDEVIKSASKQWASYLRLSMIGKVSTKVRYYYNGDKYAAHTDWRQDFLLFTYFHTEPKRFTGGEVHFPEYDYTFSCDNNTLIIFPGYVQHEVKEVVLDDDDYWNGNGRYCISQFLSIDPESIGSYIKHHGGPPQYD